MPWNWQHLEWPEFTWDQQALEAYENTFQYESGVLIGASRHFSEHDKTQLIVDLMTDEAMKTSQIEGEHLNRDSVQASLRRHFGLDAASRRIPPAEYGIAEMMTDLYRRFDVSLSDNMLFGWHEMLTNGRRDLKDIGRYRTHEDAMQVVSGPYKLPLRSSIGFYRLFSDLVIRLFFVFFLTHCRMILCDIGNTVKSVGQ